MENDNIAPTIQVLRNMRVRLVDHKVRHDRKNQGVIYVSLLAKNYSSQKEMDDEKSRLIQAQKDKNELWATQMGIEPVNPGAGQLNLVAAKAVPVYTSVIKLNLDANTGNTVLLCGSSKSGKTYLQMEIYRQYFIDYVSILFAQNAQLDQYKAKNLIRSDEYLPKIIDIFRQINKASRNKFDFLVMFDDMLSLKTDKNVTDLFLSLRNSKISSVISLQYLNLMSKSCRGNVNTIFAGAHNSDENIVVLIRCYLASWMKSIGITNELDMVRHYRELTRNHGFIQIHPASESVTLVRLGAGLR